MRKQKMIRKLAEILVEYEFILVIVPVVMAVIAKIANPACDFVSTLLTLMIMFAVLRFLLIRMTMPPEEPQKKRRRTYK